MSVTRYTRTAMVFHWLLAFLLIAMLALGWSFDFIPPGSTRHLWQDVHKALGSAILVLALLRVLWRVTHRPPKTPAARFWQAALAWLTHWALYGFMLLMPVSGLLFTNYGRGITFFGIQVPQFWGAPDEDLQSVFHRIHDVAPYAFVALIALHVTAALWHQFVLRDRTINRMLPE